MIWRTGKLGEGGESAFSNFTTFQTGGQQKQLLQEREGRAVCKRLGGLCSIPSLLLSQLLHSVWRVGFRFRVEGLGFGVWDLGFRLLGLGIRVWGLAFASTLSKPYGYRV